MHMSWGSLGRVIGLVALSTVFQHATARADLGACGQIDVRAEAECEVVPPSAQCETMCTPISVRASCSAKLAASCDASCSKLPSVDCHGTCEAGCKGDCMIDPGKFDCRADCQADCDGRCAAGCASKGDKTACMASCSGSCSVSCDNQCDVQLPKADCNAVCKASCEGSCKVETNLDCQVDCQAKGYAKCEADVTGGCKTRCQGKKGTLFCDGNYVDTGDNLQECVDALKATLNAHVMGSASGTSSCTGNECTASGKASVSSDCSVQRAGKRESATPALLLLALGIAYAARRRSRH